MDKRSMNSRYKKHKITFFVLLALGVAIFLLFQVQWDKVAIFHPKGIIAQQESSLIITAVLLMSIIVIPVFILTAWFAYKYREGNKSAKFTPNWDHDLKTGLILWLIPSIIIAVIAVINWKSTHALDPYKPLASNAKPITIQVVALRWKWLFIYPEQNIATVNLVEFPNSVPVDFQLTADAPMSSFWIPQLGGQIYAMAGMSTHLHLMANAPGEFPGSAAEINGQGFAGMKFKAIASAPADFDNWVRSVKTTSPSLSLSEFNKLAQPTENNSMSGYSTVQKNLYNTVISKYMMPTEGVQ
jgi:cytochrome o ubiquinol oxidase subunit 2